MKKVGKFDETRPKKIWALSEKIFFLASKILGYVKARNCEQSSQFNNLVYFKYDVPHARYNFSDPGHRVQTSGNTEKPAVAGVDSQRQVWGLWTVTQAMVLKIALYQ